MPVLSDLSSDLAAIVDAAGRSVVRVEARRRIPASGIIWSADGDVLLALHDVEQGGRDAGRTRSGYRRGGPPVAERGPDRNTAGEYGGPARGAPGPGARAPPPDRPRDAGDRQRAGRELAHGGRKPDRPLPADRRALSPGLLRRTPRGRRRPRAGAARRGAPAGGAPRPTTGRR